MYRFWLFILFICGFITDFRAQLPANCGADINRMAIAGDSWAQYMYDDGSFNSLLKSFGHADKIAVSESYESEILCTPSPGADDYAVSGSLASEWADETNFNYLQNLIDALNANLHIDMVVLSIGGNDILAGRSGGGWYKDMDLDNPGSEQALFDRIEADTEYIMDEVWLRARPDIKFVISGYDYPNFNVNFLLCGFYACPKREDLSRDPVNDLITDQELNDMMLGVEAIRHEMADADPKIFYDNSLGIAHHYFGFGSTSQGSTPEPQGESPYLPGGDPTQPSDRDNFRLVGVCGSFGLLSADPIHLDEETYQFKIKNMYDHVVFEQYRGQPDATFYSEPINDGYVDRITGAISGSGLRIGDEGPFCCSGGADNDYYSILSFDTESLPDDATITGASIYMIRSGADDNPLEHDDRNPELDIISGFFGSNEGLQSGDGTVTADASDIGCFHGQVGENKDALRIDVDPSALSFINILGKTQVRLSINVSDWSNEYVNFYDGGGLAAYAPPTEAQQRFDAQPYASRTIRKTINEQGEEVTNTIEVGKIMQRKEGYIYHEKLMSRTHQDDGSVMEVYKMIVALEHEGLAKHMRDEFNGPGNGFAPFMDVTFTQPLPLEILEFKAKKVGLSAQLNWKTATEINNAGFVIEYSIDGNQWAKVGFVASKGGSSINTYHYNHRNINVGDNYYRLRIVDNDGAHEFSNIRVIRENAAVTLSSIYPNPFNDQLHVQLKLNKNMPVAIRLMDLMGRTILHRQYIGGVGLFKQSIDQLDQLVSGTYVLEIIADDVYATKVIKR